MTARVKHTSEEGESTQKMERKSKEPIVANVMNKIKKKILRQEKLDIL